MPAQHRVVTEPTPHLHQRAPEERPLLEAVEIEDRLQVAQLEHQVLDHGLSRKQGLLKAARAKANLRDHYDVVRNGELLFGFDLQPLTEDEIDECADQATTWIEDKKWGPVAIPERTDKADYRRRLIHRATPEPDCSQVWGDKDLWDALDVLQPHDAVRVLLPGEVEECIAKINALSGFKISEREEHTGRRKGRDQAKR